MSRKLAVSPAAARSLPQGPVFYFRPEHQDHNFLEHYPRRGLFDAALISGRYLAPHPRGSRAEKQWGWTGRELTDALASSGTPFGVDPDTAVLVAVTATSLPTPRVGLMPHAQVLPLPLKPMSFAIAADRIMFAQAVAAAQAGAAALAAPYLQFERDGDRWHKLNLDLLGDVASMAQGRPLAAFVQVPIESLVAGDLAFAAPSYAKAGADIAFLRIAGFDPEAAPARAVRAYRGAVDAYENVGVAAVADSVGRFGLVMAAAGASGFSSGARYFKKIPEELTYDIEESRGEKCLFEVPKRWFAMDPRVAAKTPGLPACPLTGCDALRTQQPTNQKEHLIHYFVHEVRAHAAAGAAAAKASLQRYPAGNTAAWVSAV